MEPTLNNNPQTQSDILQKVKDVLDYYKVDNAGREVILKNISDQFDLKSTIQLLKEKSVDCDLSIARHNKSIKYDPSLYHILNELRNKMPIRPIIESFMDKVKNIIFPKVILNPDYIKLSDGLDKEILSKVDYAKLDSYVKLEREDIAANCYLDRIIGLDHYLDLYREVKLLTMVEKISNNAIFFLDIEKSGLASEMQAISTKVQDLNSNLTECYRDLIGVGSQLENIHINPDLTFYYYRNDSMAERYIGDFIERIPEEFPFMCKQELVELYQSIVSSGLNDTYRDSFGEERTALSWKDCIPKLSDETLIQPKLADLINFDSGDKYDSILQHEIVKLRGILPESHIIEFKEALVDNDFIKISALKEEGYVPSQDLINDLKSGGTPQYALIAVKRIFDLNIVSNDLSTGDNFSALKKNHVINEALQNTFPNLS